MPELCRRLNTFAPSRMETYVGITRAETRLTTHTHTHTHTSPTIRQPSTRYKNLHTDTLTLSLGVFSLSSRRIKLSAYSVPSFSTLRMALVCLVSSLTRFIERALTSAQATQLLDALPQSIWKMLSSLFIDYRSAHSCSHHVFTRSSLFPCFVCPFVCFAFSHNNLYQAQFYRIFRFALRAGHLPTLRPLLSKSKLVSRMISAYTDAEPSSKGTQAQRLM